jgi:4-diphosphocytidyl-2-C-methyl-D-erythritol kinase
MKPRLVAERARAKINLGLHILGRQTDGYHEVDSVVAFADVADVLALSPAHELCLEISGPFARGLPAAAENIVLKAWHQMSAVVGKSLGPVKILLEKNLPIAAGIGGGSADAAATLRGLIELFDLDANSTDLQAIALRLGADVPVCLAQRSCRMRGIGQIMEPLDVALPVVAVLVNPCVPASTSRVFETLGLDRGQVHGTKIQNLEDIKTWRNDLTASAIRLVPEIATVLETLGSHSAISTARMSGSGATCFGLAETLEQAQAAAKAISSRRPDWWVVAANLG